MTQLKLVDLGQTANHTGIHVDEDTLFIDVEAIAHHRNGVCGDPFFVVTFATQSDGDVQRFVATCFFAYDGETDRYANYSMPRVALLERGLLANGDIEFGSNSWRGDRYADMLLEACQLWTDR